MNTELFLIYIILPGRNTEATSGGSMNTELFLIYIILPGRNTEATSGGSMSTGLFLIYYFTWQEYRSYFWWKSEYRVISDPREYTAQVSFTSLKTKYEGSNKAVFLFL
jgi:hypothetical protein